MQHLLLFLFLPRLCVLLPRAVRTSGPQGGDSSKAPSDRAGRGDTGVRCRRMRRATSSLRFLRPCAPAQRTLLLRGGRLGVVSAGSSEASGRPFLSLASLSVQHYQPLRRQDAADYDKRRCVAEHRGRSLLSLIPGGGGAYPALVRRR